MTLIHSNNFSTTLNGNITNSQSTMTLTSTTGAPTVGSGVNCNFTITDGTNYEIVQATSLSTSTYTIVRAQESTTARAWASGTTVEINCTALSLDSKLDSAAFTDALISTSDITTNNVSITKHGFAPKAPNDATKYLDGTGAYSVPAGGGGGFPWAAFSTSQTATVNNGYIANSGSTLVLTLPTTAARGSVVGLTSESASWTLTAGTGQTIKYLGQTTSSGGSISPASPFDIIYVLCVVANTTWVAHGTSTNFTFS